MVRKSPDQDNFLFDRLAKRRKQMNEDRESVSESDLLQSGKDTSVRSSTMMGPQQPTPTVAPVQLPTVVPQPEANQDLLAAIRKGKALNKSSGGQPAAPKAETPGVFGQVQNMIEKLPPHLQDDVDEPDDEGKWN